MAVYINALSHPEITIKLSGIQEPIDISFVYPVLSNVSTVDLSSILQQLISAGNQETNIAKRDLYEQIIGKLQELIDMDRELNKLN